MKHWRACVLGMALILGAACGSPRRGVPFGRVVESHRPILARGELAFQKYCHSCHPGGEGGLGPTLNEKPIPSWLLKTQVRVGLGVMPDFSEEEISEEELDALAAYAQALHTAD